MSVNKKRETRIRQKEEVHFDQETLEMARQICDGNDPTIFDIRLVMALESFSKYPDFVPLAKYEGIVSKMRQSKSFKMNQTKTFG